MSESMNIFVDTRRPLDEFIQELEQLFHRSFQCEIDPVDNQVMYTFDDDKTSIRIYKHEFDNDRDLLYEEYPYFIDVRAKRRKNWEEAEAWQKELGSQIFEALKKTGEYRLLMVWDLQLFLEKFDPGKE